MKNRIAKSYVSAISAIYALHAQTVFAQSQGTQTGSIAPLNPIDNLPGDTDLASLLTKIINYFLGLVGLIAVLMLIIGGIRYVTSGGNEQTVEKAKSTILYAIIGIVIVVLSYAIVFTITNALDSLG